jgi:hypothetical protein
MTIDLVDTRGGNVTDITTARRPEPLPLVDPAKAAKLRSIIQARQAAERAATEAHAEADRLRQRITALENDPIDARDHRMRHIWIDAARAAVANDHCSEYDQIVEDVGGLTRDELRDDGELTRGYRVRTHVTVEVYLSIDANDEDDAISRIDDLDSDDLRALLRNEVGHAIDDVTVESWDAREADEDD